MKMLQLTAEEKFGEEISHLEHAIQTYYYLHDQDLEMRVAGFWHDIGHSTCVEASAASAATATAASKLMLAKDGTILGVHDHDLLGAGIFKDIFPERTRALISMHTMAKRYQVGRSTSLDLSDASTTTYHLEGGALTPEEQEQFEQNPYFRDALVLRNADNLGKDPHFPQGNYPKLLLQALADTMQLVQETEHLAAPDV